MLRIAFMLVSFLLLYQIPGQKAVVEEFVGLRLQRGKSLSWWGCMRQTAGVAAGAGS